MSRREPGNSLPYPALSSLDQSSSIRFVATGTDEALNAIDIPFRVDTTLQYYILVTSFHAGLILPLRTGLLNTFYVLNLLSN